MRPSSGGVGGVYFEAEEGLSEDLLRWEAAEDLVEPVDFDVASFDEMILRSAVFDPLALSFSVGKLLCINGDFVAQTCS